MPRANANIAVLVRDQEFTFIVIVPIWVIEHFNDYLTNKENVKSK